MENDYSLHFKECSPDETVTKLKNILKALGIEIEEIIDRKSSIDTYTMRVIFKGTSFGSNGKGVSKKYCEASAYAELFERYQNDLMDFWPSMGISQFGFYRTFDEKLMSAAEIVSEMNSFMQFYFQKRNMGLADFTEKVDEIEKYQKLDYFIYGLTDQYITVPFYSLKEKSVINMPYGLYSTYYGSNGMCAGNTYEEALVQGLSEIFERVAQRRILTEKPCLPDIPYSVLVKYPVIKNIYEKLDQSEKYTFYLKDCSFGGKYPVAGLIAVEKNTGKFGVKLGCHPDFGIALERCFTEATQGREIYEYSNSSELDFSNYDVDADYNICNSYKIGNARWPYQILGNNPDYEFTEPEDIRRFTNKELLKKWVDSILDQGYDILIRDVSYLDFPSFHIIIPGVSELQEGDETRCKANNTKWYLCSRMANFDELDDNCMGYMITTIDFFLNICLENTADIFFPEIKDCTFPGKDVECSLPYLKAMCFAFLEKYSEAADIMFFINNVIKNYNIVSENSSFYLGVAQYLSARANGCSHSTTMDYINVFFDKELTRRINDIFSDKVHIFSKQYPESSIENLRENTFKSIQDNRDKLFLRQIKSRINQYTLAELFD